MLAKVVGEYSRMRPANHGKLESHEKEIAGCCLARAERPTSDPTKNRRADGAQTKQTLPRGTENWRLDLLREPKTGLRTWIGEKTQHTRKLCPGKKKSRRVLQRQNARERKSSVELLSACADPRAVKTKTKLGEKIQAARASSTRRLIKIQHKDKGKDEQHNHNVKIDFFIELKQDYN
jgi:hypothetical protein